MEETDPGKGKLLPNFATFDVNKDYAMRVFYGQERLIRTKRKVCGTSEEFDLVTGRSQPLCCGYYKASVRSYPRFRVPWLCGRN
jgi:hypothetical protein